jgi:hypothetical protein
MTKSNITPEKRRVVILRHGPACFYCRRALAPQHLTMDHRVPRCRGGTSHESNLVPCCRPCNTRKGPLTAEEYFRVIHDDRARDRLIAAVHANLGNGLLKRDGTHLVPRATRRHLTWKPFDGLLAAEVPLPLC